MSASEPDFSAIRAAMAAFDPSPRVEPNAMISVEQAFLPQGHRGVLDLRRQLVVGDRGTGKSFWTHALLSKELRGRLAAVYRHRLLSTAEVIVGFNGSDKVSPTAPTIDEITNLFAQGINPDLIWRAVLIRIASKYVLRSADEPLGDVGLLEACAGHREAVWRNSTRTIPGSSRRWKPSAGNSSRWNANSCLKSGRTSRLCGAASRQLSEVHRPSSQANTMSPLRLGRQHEKFVRLDVQHGGELHEDLYAHPGHPALDAGHVGAVYAGFVRQRLLRDASGSARDPYVAGDDLSKILLHAGHKDKLFRQTMH
jgi:hypothetical protein